MSLNLSSAAILEKNKLAGEGAWIVLLKLILSDGTTLRLARNNEDVTWDSNTWTAFPFELDEAKESGKGEHQTITVKVGNVSRAIQAYMEDYDGGVGADVTLYVVHSEHLDLTSAEIEESFIITSSYSDSQWAYFDLSAPNQVFVLFPPFRYMKNFCRWSFKGTRCGYSGAYNACNKTLADCRQRNNARYFGGFPGIPEGGIYVNVEK